MPRARRLRPLAFSTLLVAGCAAPAAPELSGRDQGIVAGTVTTAYPEIVALAVSDDPTPQVIYCTATLIGPRVALTAGHCIIDAQAEVFFGGDPSQGGRFVHSSEGITHPDYELALVDLGLVFLDAPAPEGAVTARLPETAATPGEQLQIVGFGLTESEDGKGSDSGDSGIKREVEATVLEEDAGIPGFFALTTSGCSGDSGGGDLRLGGDESEVVGVNSYISEFPCSRSLMFSVQVAPHRAWIEAEVAKRGLTLGGLRAGGDAGPVGADAGPGADEDDGGCGCRVGGQPGTRSGTWAVLGALGILGAALVRRRRADPRLTSRRP